jgi:hypothetical protein
VHHEPEAALLSWGDVLDPASARGSGGIAAHDEGRHLLCFGPLALELRLEAAALETRLKDTGTVDPDANLRNHDLRYFSIRCIIYCKTFTN